MMRRARGGTLGAGCRKLKKTFIDLGTLTCKAGGGGGEDIPSDHA